MTNKEAIKMQEAIKAGLKETGKDHPYRDALIPLMKKSCDMAIEALETQDVARERYEDLCEYFNNNPHTIETILNDRKEFKAWLERMHWHVLECNKLARKLEALEGKDNVPDTNVGDTISRRAAIEAIRSSTKKYTGFMEMEMYTDDDAVEAIIKLPPSQPERWDTCFSCPLSHGCPFIKGCTNDQAEQYAGEIPTDCPLDKEYAQPVDKEYLCDWFINSVCGEPTWTEEHILELVNDFYVIPKEKR